MSLINDDTYGDSAIRLKTLEKEYDVLLKQYLEAKNNYIEALQDNATGKSSYVTRYNVGINGIPSKIIKDVNSLEDCKALCSENKCDGAMYMPLTDNLNQHDRNYAKMCGLYIDTPRMNFHEYNGSFITIIKEYKGSLKTMSDIVSKLLVINAQMLEAAENMDPTYQQDIDIKKDRADELYKNYKNLINERDIVNQKMDEYSMLSQKYSDENINAERQYWLVSAFGFVVFLIFVFALREIFQIPISFFPIFIGAIVFFLGLNLGIPTGFLIWLGVIALLLFLYFMNMA